MSLITKICMPDWMYFFRTCQVRVVRYYVNSRSSFSSAASFASSPDLNYDDHSRVFAAGPQPRPSAPSVRCRTSTTTSHAQCSLPDLNHDQPRPVFAAGPQPRPATPSVRAAGPQPRPATPSVRCRTSTTTTHAQCSLLDLNHDHPRPVFAAGPQPPKDMPDRMSEDMTDRMSEDMPDRMSEDTSDRMPDRTSDTVPDRMPEKNAR